ncbi:MAG: dihydroneopterin aldolase [Candidatus Dormibacteraeota bacterium]|nr:dihydroneopterin aldolase [Candidatus Dormibacteraeota bacterium]
MSTPTSGQGNAPKLHAHEGPATDDPVLPPGPLPGRLLLHGLRFFGHHGDGEPERRLGGHFVVDVELTVDLSEAARSDRLADTVPYPLAHEVARRITEEGEYHLLEALAARIAAAELALPGVLGVRVRVTKQPRLPQQTVGFAVELALP